MASFDEDPRDMAENYPCPHCNDGVITFNPKTGKWECNACSYSFDAMEANK